MSARQHTVKLRLQGFSRKAPPVECNQKIGLGLRLLFSQPVCKIQVVARNLTIPGDQLVKKILCGELNPQLLSRILNNPAAGYRLLSISDIRLHPIDTVGIVLQPADKNIPFPLPPLKILYRDRKSTRLNSSHVAISYAVFCLK